MGAVVRAVWLFLALAVVRGSSARMVPVAVEYLYPPFNLTYFHFIDTDGVFLLSPNGNFSGAVYNAGSISASDSQSRFFFAVLHSASHTPVWSATAPGSTILQSVVLSLSAGGLTLFDPSAARPDPAWSTPRLQRPVAALRLLDTGELRLIDGGNATLWSSWERPTDTLLPGQALVVPQLGQGGAGLLTSSTSEQDLTPGAYRLVVTAKDALLQWDNVTYWALSSDPAAVQDSSHAVASMAANASGIYLLAANGRDTVYRLLFPSLPPSQQAEGVVIKVDPWGRLRALTLPAAAVWTAPADDCELPLRCRSLGICTPGGNGSTCGCPDAFSTYSSGGCAPADGSLVADPDSDSCNNEQVRYVSLGAGIGYPPNKFALPETSGDSLQNCRDLCSGNCSFLGFFYKNSSRSCFLVRNQMGSVVFQQAASSSSDVGFIKTLPKNPADQNKGGRGGAAGSLSFITIVFGIVLPTVAAVFIALLLYAMLSSWRWRLKNNKSNNKGGLPAMLSSSRGSSKNGGEEDDDLLIPGLPTRFTYGDLDAATDGFRWQIGCGGFGSVFRGELPDRSTVAVKRMNGMGSTTQGRRQFLTEIAVIGNVHHVNLVKLRGFCAEGARQLLVYEYMNRGSLDQTLFRRRHSNNNNEVLDWPARLRVCIGAARGLAYLHAGCDRKILHCDVKPENILLDDHGAVKIADFGLAKLMSPEQSGLFTTMRGTRGYLAPEWLMNAPITDKADVYSFGMVLLEIVRGTKNCSSNNSSSKSTKETNNNSVQVQEEVEEKSKTSYFPALALDLHEQGRYSELVDPRLQGCANADEVARVVRVALCCLHEDAALRPNMTAVSAMLDGSMDAGEPRSELLLYLRMYGRGLVAGLKDPNTKGRGSDTTAGESSSWSRPSCVSAQQLSGPR